MKCNETRERLKPFNDGELGVEEAASVQDHLNHCAHCRADLQAIKAVWEILNVYPEAVVPHGFSRRVVARAEDAGKKRGSVFSWLWGWRARPLGWATALVFCGGLFVGGKMFQVWSYRVDQKLEAYWGNQEPYALEAFQGFPARSLLEGYWKMLPVEEDEDIS